MASETNDEIPEYHKPGRSRRNGSTQWPSDRSRRRVLVVTRGHPFARDAFFAMFERNHAIEWSHVEHPAAQAFFTPEQAKAFDCFVLYDMPGIDFVPGEKPIFFEPPEEFKAGLRAMGQAGCPLIVMHHSIAAWPAWPEWAEIVGGQFLYQPGPCRGQEMPDSGYRLDAVHTLSGVGDHPITSGIEPFEIQDEVYLSPVFEDSIVPLLQSDFEFVDTNFHSPAQALEGKLNSREGWSHPPGSNIVGWVKTYGKSPLVYLQFGDGPSAYEHTSTQKILANSIQWATSDEARLWAREAAGKNA